MPDPRPAPPGESQPTTRHSEDLDLARRVLADDASAWRTFIERYAGLLYSVIRRQIWSADTDEVRTVLVDLLVAVRRSKLWTYEGRASLSTWLTLVARTHALDHLRRKHGRLSRHKLLTELTQEDRDIIRLHHQEGRCVRQVLAVLRASSPWWTLDRLLERLEALERRMGTRWLRDLAYGRHAGAVGALSARLLAYVDHVRDELLQQQRAGDPELQLLEQEARRTAQRLTVLIAGLEPEERRLLDLRFVRGRTAREIADELGIESSRFVYSWTDRVVRKLRRGFLERGSGRP